MTVKENFIEHTKKRKMYDSLILSPCFSLSFCPPSLWQAPHMPRLGLLAASTSDGHITIYSLPHPDTLMARRKHTAKG